MAPNPGDENLVFACELDEPELQTRGADWTTLAAHVRSKVRTDKGFRIVYEPMAADALRSLVEAERLCCAWATWTCETSNEGEVLEVTGPSEPITSLAEIFGV